MGGERNQPEPAKTFLAWDQTGVLVDTTNTWIVSPSFPLTSPWLSAALDLDVHASDTFTDVSFGLQAATRWVDDDDANWWPLIRPGAIHGVKLDQPFFTNAGPVKLFTDAVFTQAAGSKVQHTLIDAQPGTAGTVPVVAQRVRLIAGITGTMTSANQTTWKIWVTEKHQ